MSKFRECLFGPTIPWCTWAQHAVIAAAIVWLACIITGALGGTLVAVGTAAVFFWRETRQYGGAFDNLDSIMDWVVPLVAAAAVAAYWWWWFGCDIPEWLRFGFDIAWCVQ